MACKSHISRLAAQHRYSTGTTTAYPVSDGSFRLTSPASHAPQNPQRGASRPRTANSLGGLGFSRTEIVGMASESTSPDPLPRVGAAWPMSRAVASQRTNKAMLSTSEAAAALGVHARTVRRYVAAGLLVAQRLPGGHLRIPQAAIGGFWDRHSAHKLPLSTRSQDASEQHARRRRSSPHRHTDTDRARYDLSNAALRELRERLS
jgi:excisionase family DNA binding protein